MERLSGSLCPPCPAPPSAECVIAAGEMECVRRLYGTVPRRGRAAVALDQETLMRSACRPAGTREISAPDRAPRGHASTWGQRCVSLLTVYFSLGFVIVFVFG